MDSNRGKNPAVQTAVSEDTSQEGTDVDEDELLAWVEDFLSDDQIVHDDQPSVSGKSESGVECGEEITPDDKAQEKGQLEIDHENDWLESDNDGVDATAVIFHPGEKNHRPENGTEVKEDELNGGSMERNREGYASISSGDTSADEENGDSLPYTSTDVQPYLPDDDDEKGESESTQDLGDSGVEAGNETPRSDWLEEDNSEEPDVEAGGSDAARHSEPTSACCLEVFHDMLYYLRMCPKKSDGTNPWGKANYISLTLVRLITLLGTLEYLKIYLIFGDPVDDVAMYYITIGYRFNIFLIRYCFAYLLATRFDEIVRIVKAVKEFGAGSSRIMIAVVVGVPLATSIALSISTQILRDRNNLPVDERQIEDFIVGRSYIFSKTLFLWSDKNYKNDTEYLRDTYGSDVSATSVSFALISHAIKYVGYLNENVIRDFGLVVAFTVFLISKSVRYTLERAMENTDEGNCKRLWATYKQARNISTMINGCFWAFFYCLHLDNLLFCVYFLLDNVKSEKNVPFAVARSTVIAKIIVFYLLGAKAAAINSQFEGWILEKFRGMYTPFIEGSEKVTTNNLLVDLDKNPIGIGEKMAFIGGTLIFQLLSTLGSTFIMLAAAVKNLQQ